MLINQYLANYCYYFIAGIRFAKVQSMIGLAAFLKRFKVTPSDNSKRDLSFDAKSITLTSDRGIWVKITKR